MEPQITVVTASWNRPEVLKRAVRSVMGQTYPHWELIISYDAKQTKPLLDLHKFGLVGRCRILQHPKVLHMIENQEAGCRAATTPYVNMLDDDNWFYPTHLEHLLRVLKKTQSDFVWGSSLLRRAKNDMPFMLRDNPSPTKGHVDASEILFKRENLDKWGGQRKEDHRGADGAMIERWVAQGARYYHSCEATLNYIDHDFMWPKFQREFADEVRLLERDFPREGLDGTLDPGRYDPCS